MTVLICPQCETRPVAVRGTGRVKHESRCRPCASAGRSLERYWSRDMDMPLSFAESRARIMLPPIIRES